MENKVRYSVVIAVYNSSQSLFELSNRIHKVFSETIRESYELLFIDDGSSNSDTWKTLIQLQTTFPSVRIFQLSRNFGQQPATLCGIEHATGEFVITMDDDLQHFPEDIPLLIKEKKHDIVIGYLKDRQDASSRQLTSKIKGWFDQWLINKPRGLKLSSFRLIHKTIAENMLRIQSPFPYLPAMMFYVSNDIVNVEVTHGKRKQGKSGYNFLKQVKLFTNLLINNSSFLLKAIAIFGITLSSVSFLTMVYFILKKLTFGVPIVGWTSLMVTILGVGGMLLFAVGILGEYLIRLLAGVEKRPTYIVRKTIQGPEDEQR